MLLFPGNIPEAKYSDLSAEEQLMFFASPTQLYLDGLKLIRKYNRYSNTKVVTYDLVNLFTNAYDNNDRVLVYTGIAYLPGKPS